MENFSFIFSSETPNAFPPAFRTLAKIFSANLHLKQASFLSPVHNSRATSSLFFYNPHNNMKFL